MWYLEVGTVVMLIVAVKLHFDTVFRRFIETQPTVLAKCARHISTLVAAAVCWPFVIGGYVIYFLMELGFAFKGKGKI